MFMKLHVEERIAIAHQLNLPYSSPCNHLHGHTLKVEVEVERWVEKGENCDILIDAEVVKRVVRRFDHTNLNDHLEQPTMENLAQLIARNLVEAVKEDKFLTEERKECLLSGTVRVRVWESEKAFVEFECCGGDLL